ncbi:ABC transporter ATP-binding protein [Micromonospora sp. DR5-3]|uniref:ABC transporter ATP-binding protein n=1 Tax=unclassified Micromonospora TaxID=2617518 RepID=UPI0011DAD727|nr:MULTISPECIES: ABC transporter ATP-binding protein [unclassified Micromonospora]MCW3816737.1 ABC transporter ATP-binding protein [Micromonospora sp. DR5-3]TYC20685.1 ABC transporter ATP-binding protein [Micromonospora sp. MP36]
MTERMVTLTGVTKSYGRVTALAGVDLDVARGDLLAVLGPSGCGKTTLLRCLAGFERVDSGVVTVAGRQLAGDRVHVPPHRRRVAVVPQDGALFPHLSVADNVGYGLARADRRGSRVEEVLALVGLAGYGGRMPHQLSGGQQQRVAVARALAPRPPLVLLDEPFSALDAQLRGELRADVRQALRADGATVVLVTHDQGEALSMADAVAVMQAGRIVQCGPPAEVYRNPADPWVAAFVGDAVLLPATVDVDVAVTPLGRLPLRGPATGGTVTVLIRPEQLRLAPSGGSAATVVRQDFHGHDALTTLRLPDGTLLTARTLDEGAALSAGTQVRVTVRGQVRAYAGPV